MYFHYFYLLVFRCIDISQFSGCWTFVLVSIVIVLNKILKIDIITVNSSNPWTNQVPVLRPLISLSNADGFQCKTLCIFSFFDKVTGIQLNFILQLEFLYFVLIYCVTYGKLFFQGIFPFHPSFKIYCYRAVYDYLFNMSMLFNDNPISLLMLILPPPFFGQSCKRFISFINLFR